MIANIDAIQHELAKLRAENEALKQNNKRLQLERDHYKLQADATLRKLFAAKSEVRHHPAQKDLLFNEAEELATVASIADDKPKAVAVSAHAKKKPGRKPLDPSLPREVVRVELPEAERICAHDGARLVEIGVEASEQLDIIPAQLKVIRTERVKYACPCCDGSLKTVPVVPALIPKSVLTANTLAWIVSGKYQDALPLVSPSGDPEALWRRYCAQYAGGGRCPCGGSGAAAD